MKRLTWDCSSLVRLPLYQLSQTRDESCHVHARTDKALLSYNTTGRGFKCYDTALDPLQNRNERNCLRRTLVHQPVSCKTVGPCSCENQFSDCFDSLALPFSIDVRYLPCDLSSAFSLHETPSYQRYVVVTVLGKSSALFMSD